MESPTKITSLTVRDIRFPTTLSGDGSDSIVSITPVTGLFQVWWHTIRACHLTVKKLWLLKYNTVTEVDLRIMTMTAKYSAAPALAALTRK